VFGASSASVAALGVSAGGTTLDTGLQTINAHSSFINLLHLKSSGMRSHTALTLCAAAAGTSALQIPLLSSYLQAPIAQSGHHETKSKINSSELQDLISGDRLFARAKALYEVAKRGEDEYNHPTRVIGSAGTLHVLAACDGLADGCRTCRHAHVHLRHHCSAWRLLHCRRPVLSCRQRQCFREQVSSRQRGGQVGGTHGLDAAHQGSPARLWRHCACRE
jgi:hypothetical protein